MARGALSENERQCLDDTDKTQSERLQEPDNTNGEVKPNGLRVRFLDEEGKTERLLSTDELDSSVARVKKIYFQKNRSSSETSILLRNPSMMKRRSSDRRLSDGSDNINNNINNNSQTENRNGISILKFSELDREKTDPEQTKDNSGHYKKNTHVYSVNQAKTLTSERRKSMPMTMPRLMSSRSEGKSSLPAEGSLADAGLGKDFTARALGRLSRGLGRLLRRTNSVRISEPDPVYKVAYLGNVLTGWARGESCIEKPLATLWRNYQQSTKPDVMMKLSVTNSGLKGFTKEHGLTEYWSHRVTYCASPPHYPKLFCWVYRHEGKKLKHELRCHAVLCTKEAVSKKITEELQVKLKQALVEFKKDRISKQNARLSLANSVYDNPSMPRRKILLSVGATNYRPPLERSKSAPKLGAIEELCSEEDEEEAEMKSNKELSDSTEDDLCTQTLDRRRSERKSPRKMSCPEGVMDRLRPSSEDDTEDILNLIINECNKRRDEESMRETSQTDDRFHRLESIDESSEMQENLNSKSLLLSQSNFLVTDSDDGSVSSGCETASTVNSDTEPSSLPPHPHYPDDGKEHTATDEKISVFERIQSFEKINEVDRKKIYANSVHMMDDGSEATAEEVNHIPIGEKNFRRRSTYPPLRADSSILGSFDNKFESLIDNLSEFDSLNCTDSEVFKSAGDNESACSDESGYSELVDGKESVIGNTIMV